MMYSKIFKLEMAFFVFIISIGLFVFDIRAEDELTATITDLSGSKVTLNKVITSNIKLKIGDAEQEVPLKLIKVMFFDEKESAFKVKFVSDKEIIGSSNSEIKGAWELGDYSISLSKVKSISIEGLSQVVKWNKPEGYMAEVVQTDGSVNEIYGFGFGYTYSYTRSNCMWNCGSSSDNLLKILPLNQGKGALIIPLNKIVSISDISSNGEYPREYNASITLSDKKVTKSSFGEFGGERIDYIKGETEIGCYTLSMDKVKKIIFHHDNDILPLPKYSWGKTEEGLKASVTCQSDITTSLINVWIYEPSSSGTVSSYGGAKTVKIKIGESQNYVEISKISNIIINKDTGYKYSAELVTKTGNTITGELVDNSYIGGYTDQDWFFYVKIKDLKKITIQ